ncbi:odorant receptor Or2-like [Diachasma alloeum]|uniref:Odorant receptor n=1 Tax=Diachasma alloeum TaxID=454923 RepID=A0A4E0S125_9HYME|nr:odorant receptor Or2-like [Diachasma alloeum]THK33030.1 odorant receptor 3 [Diachasma alloeum]
MAGRVRHARTPRRDQINNGNRVGSAFEADVDYAIGIIRWLLKPLGLWPKTANSTRSERLTAIFLMSVCTFLLGFLIVPGSLFAFVKIKNPAVRLKLTGPLSFCVMGIMKYYSLVVERRNIASCIQHMTADWQKAVSTHDRDIMLTYAQFGRYGATICTGFMYSGGLFYAVILPYVSAGARTEGNGTVRSLAYPSHYVLFDPQVSPAYEVVFSTHCCCAFVMHSITSATCSLAVVFAMHACGQLEILIVWLNDLVDGSGQAEDRLSEVVEQHVRTLSFIIRAEGVLREICLVEICGCTLNICFIGYYLMMEWAQADAVGITTYTILLISFVFNIFLFCYVGELLTEECKKVGETTYMMEWYRLPDKKALGLTLVISTAQHPVTITAGGMIALSLSSFCTVIRTAVTYLNLLRTLMD